MMDTHEAAVATRGRMVNECREFSGISTDSRNIAQGSLFIALRGEHFDGHDFIHHAAAAGAVAALVDDVWANEAAVDTPVIDPKTGKPIPRAIIVDDPELQGLAREGKFGSLLRHPMLTKALNDPQLKAFLKDLKL